MRTKRQTWLEAQHDVEMALEDKACWCDASFDASGRTPHDTTCPLGGDLDRAADRRYQELTENELTGGE